MLVKEKIGNLSDYPHNGRAIDRLPLEWHECNKRILHKKTGAGKEVVIRFLSEAQNLKQDDVLHADETSLIVVEVLACDVIVICPATLYEMAFACYEIGNKHLPLFYEDDCLLMPYDPPTHRTLQASGLRTEVQQRKLLHPLRTSVLPHAHSAGESLFSKILKLTTAND